MAVRYYEWTLYDRVESAEERYCPHCGEKTLFRDSTKRRVNANGKDLFEYAIYKCERDHTWNKKLGIYKAKAACRRFEKEEPNEISNFDIIHMKACMEAGFDTIEIHISEVRGAWRLDKLLAGAIQDWSRTRIVQLLAEGKITVNQSSAKPSMAVKQGQVIRILSESKETDADQLGACASNPIFSIPSTS